MEELALAKYLNKVHWQEYDLFYILFTLISFVVQLDSVGLCHGNIKPANVVLVEVDSDKYQLRLVELEGF